MISPLFPDSTALILLFEIMLFFFALLMYIIDRDRSNRRFAILIVFFIAYNITNGFLPNWDYNWTGNIYWSILIQVMLTYGTGIALATYYFYYLISQFDIQIGRIYNVKVLVASLVVSLVLAYCIPYVFTFDKTYARQTFLAFPSIIAIYFAFNTVRFFIEKLNRKSSRYQMYISLAGSLGILFMATMPIVLIWGETHKALNHALINTALFMSLYSHVHQFIRHNQRYHPEGVKDNQYIQLKKTLTKREIEVLTFVGKGMSVKEIAEFMCVTPDTIRKHLSNTYGKAGLKQKDFSELMRKFPDISKYFFE